ncbi:hypothetical protein MTBPR1_60229 [Candidatus Terasakiella magnetica]|uniref:Hemerythrin-like domain-containing protein n=1 Tax=Candidatus Terasakiella magnetica TaxID=1867952 RepID=A0A1C3RKE4_9PROT|nr:hemerythrin family protein [Candidatus Terasakiella magnetica]SCA57716.1 hypothetical protein MTBPR1_60229 [Candidatus Terasakiella magnetica]
MSTLTWRNASHRTGHEKIDAKNKRIVSLYNQLQTISCEQNYDEIVMDVLGELVEYTDHLAIEEKILEENGYTKLDEHKRKHSAFLEELCSLCESYEDRHPQLLVKLTSLLEIWWEHHIIEDVVKNKHFIATTTH